MSIRKGSVEFHSNSSLEAGGRSTITIAGGSMSMFDYSRFVLFPIVDAKTIRSTLLNSGLTIRKGSLTLNSNSQLISTRSPIKIAGGSLTIRDYATVQLRRAAVSIKEGSFTATDHSTIELDRSRLTVISGRVTLEKDSRFESFNRTVVDVHGGDCFLKDHSSAQIEKSLLYVSSGNLVVSNKATMTFNSSKAIIKGGDMLVKDMGYVLLVEQSTMRVTTGQVRIQKDAKVILRDDSTIFNSQTITGGGYFEFPSKTSYKIDAAGRHDINEGFNIVPPKGSDSEGGPVVNEGEWRHSLASGSHSIRVPFYQKGQAKFSNGRITLTNFVQTSGNTVLDRASIRSTNKPFSIQGGYLTGLGEIEGEVRNDGVVTYGKEGLLLKIKGSYKQHKGTFEAAVYSKETGTGLSQIDIDGAAILDPKESVLVVCLNTDLKKGRYEIMKFKKLDGKFNNIRWECSHDGDAHKSRTKRSQTETEETTGCNPTIDYSSNSIAVLIAGCSSGNNKGYQIAVWVLLASTVVLAILIALASEFVRPVHKLVYGYDLETMKKKLTELSARVVAQS
eukprot:TRINITY_DN5084_c0_g1_i1.p1 TRINITY_DN5084_c0_g1~~TRINITY_DN5084_c0_g1_i1.p1  ORF type:complete len:577 (+),score=109.38 TRINITY_DN5084_c0_g1_i1:51-1733(+)